MRDTGLSPLSSLYEKIWFLQPILLLLSIFEPKKNAASRLSFLGSIQKRGLMFHTLVRFWRFGQLTVIVKYASVAILAQGVSSLGLAIPGWQNKRWQQSHNFRRPWGCQQLFSNSHSIHQQLWEPCWDRRLLRVHLHLAFCRTRSNWTTSGSLHAWSTTSQ